MGKQSTKICAFVFQQKYPISPFPPKYFSGAYQLQKSFKVIVKLVA